VEIHENTGLLSASKIINLSISIKYVHGMVSCMLLMIQPGYNNGLVFCSSPDFRPESWAMGAGAMDQ